MFFTALAVAALAVPAAAQAGVVYPDHNILMNNVPMFVGRTDPIVNPGEVSSHVHTVLGASNFRCTWGKGSLTPAFINQPAVQQEAACTSVSVVDDKSNYWHPTMYYIHDNNTFEAMLPMTRIYYFQRNETATVAWPPGMRVVSGDGMYRDEKSIKSFGIEMHCDSQEATPRTLPQGDKYSFCKGVTLNIHFPSCGWANKSLDSADHFSHLTWALDDAGNWDTRGKKCPDSHPIHYPAIMLNSVYYFDDADGKHWRAGKNNWIMSNGDLDGGSFHADFVNGWKPDVIKGVTEQCSNPHSVHENLPNCAPLKDLVNFDAARQCAFQGQVPAEDIGLLRAIDKLPGCNPVWTKEMGPSKPKCDNPPPSPGFATPNVYYGQGWDSHIPLWVPDVPDITSWVPDMDWPGWVGAWGVKETTKNGQAWPANADTVMKPNPEDVKQKKTFPVDKVFGMSDETPYNVKFDTPTANSIPGTNNLHAVAPGASSSSSGTLPASSGAIPPASSGAVPPASSSISPASPSTSLKPSLRKCVRRPKRLRRV